MPYVYIASTFVVYSDSITFWDTVYLLPHTWHHNNSDSMVFKCKLFFYHVYFHSNEYVNTNKQTKHIEIIFNVNNSRLKLDSFVKHQRHQLYFCLEMILVWISRNQREEKPDITIHWLTRDSPSTVHCDIHAKIIKFVPMNIYIY